MPSLLDQDGLSSSLSNAPPTHYTLTIESFSMLTENSVDTYESGEFDAGGYKWRLVVYPNGNTKKNAQDHISVYLKMAEANSLRTGWEVFVDFRLFLLEQNKGIYVVLQDANMNKMCLHGAMLQVGFDRVIPREILSVASNGFLIDDTCVLGAEVFVFKERRAGKAECLSMIKKNDFMNKHCWKIESFPTLKSKSLESELFTAGGQKWIIKLYPKGVDDGESTHVSVYLNLANPEKLSPGSQLLIEYTLRIVDQLNGKHASGKANPTWFSASRPSWGFPCFIKLCTFKMLNKGYLVKNTCLVEAEVTVHGIARALESTDDGNTRNIPSTCYGTSIKFGRRYCHKGTLL